MKTSRTIKQRQYKPVEPIRRDSGVVAVFESEVRLGTYYTTKRHHDRRHYSCRCPATGLCKHITSMVMTTAKLAGWELVQVWTSEDDARRQHRQIVPLFANGRPFWVTLARRPHRYPKSA